MTDICLTNAMVPRGWATESESISRFLGLYPISPSMVPETSPISWLMPRALSAVFTT